eukprot:357663-Chlamydomonas_euryale.AAC.3
MPLIVNTAHLRHEAVTKHTWSPNKDTVRYQAAGSATYKDDMFAHGDTADTPHISEYTMSHKDPQVRGKLAGPHPPRRSRKPPHAAQCMTVWLHAMRVQLRSRNFASNRRVMLQHATGNVATCTKPVALPAMHPAGRGGQHATLSNALNGC